MVGGLFPKGTDDFHSGKKGTASGNKSIGGIVSLLKTNDCHGQ